MSGVTTSRPARGLSAGAGSDLDWRQRGRCRYGDPNRFHIKAGRWSPTNEQAADVCRRCPVRVECRDHHFGLLPPPRSIIAGGWRWDAGGRAKPLVDGEDHLAPGGPPPSFEPEPDPVPVPPRRPGSRRRARAETGRRFLAAGRALAGGEPIGVVERRFDLSRSLIYSARDVLKHCPDLVDDVAAGTASIYAARIELYRRRAEQ